MQRIHKNQDVVQRFRTLFLRIAEVNNTREGVKIYTTEKIVEIVRKWAVTTKMSFFIIHHDTDEEDNFPHSHLVFSFVYPQKRENILKKLPYGSHLESAVNLRACVRYLVHAGKLSKRQYKWEEIITNDPKTLVEFKKDKKGESREELNELIDKIGLGLIKECDLTKVVTPLFFARFRTDIENAYNYKYRKETMQINRQISNAFVEGTTGIGKTRFVIDYCKRKKWSVCQSSSSNDPLQDYRGQDVLFLDDLRDTTFELEDLLKLLDPYYRSSSKSRYRNKLFTGKQIIIASNQPLDSWYIRDYKAEQIAPLYRRLRLLYQMDKNSIRCLVYNDKLYKYEYNGTLLNKYGFKRHKSALKDIRLDIGLKRIEDPREIKFQGQIIKEADPVATAEAERQATIEAIDILKNSSIF